jgi:DNA-binding IclR family transcriptional regulator
VGVGAVAAPLYGADGVLVASLTTIFPITMVSQRELRLLETEVRHTAERISAGLRGEPADAPVRPVRRAAR